MLSFRDVARYVYNNSIQRGTKEEDESNFLDKEKKRDLLARV